MHHGMLTSPLSIMTSPFCLSSVHHHVQGVLASAAVLSEDLSVSRCPREFGPVMSPRGQFNSWGEGFGPLDSTVHRPHSCPVRPGHSEPGVPWSLWRLAVPQDRVFIGALWFNPPGSST